MKPYVLVTLAVFASLVGAVSVRLLRLAWRTRRAPELLLGLSTALPLVAFTFGMVATAITFDNPMKWIAEVTGTVCDLGFVATVGFVWIVFRKEERWAFVLSALIVLGFAAMPFVNHFVPWQNGVPSALVARGALRTICYAWAAFESLQYGRIMRRRVRYGLAEPLVADRFMLWGLAHLCMGLMLLFIMAGVKFHFVGDALARACTLAGFFLGLVAVIPLTLSFFPPNVYIRHVERRFRMEATA